MAEETLAFVETFANALITKHDLRKLLNFEGPIIMLTDSRALFRILTWSRYTIERLPEIYVNPVRESYNNIETSKITFT